MGMVSMSSQEFSRLDVLIDLSAGRIKVEDAGRLLGLGRSQVFRLLRGFRVEGATSLISRRRGRPSNNKITPTVRDLAMALVKERYADFGPTLACEKLSKTHGCGVSCETLRQWMIADGLWADRSRRLARVHQPRNRRERVGELIQIDGSKHAWFEERGPQCTLIIFIDDATSRLMHGSFVPSESTFDYLRETKAYVARYGRPVAFYSDKHAIFRVNHKEARGGDGMTQFTRALGEINIDLICANGPQAKGRVERSFGTLQDRLVKEMRLAGIDTPEAGNAFLPGFLDQHNDRFAKPPFSPVDGHRLLPDGAVLEDIFAWKEQRTVTHNLTVQYDKVMIILEPNALTRPLARKLVTVIDYPDGHIALRHNSADLPYRTFDKLQKVDQGAIVENKRLGAVLAHIAERQKELDVTRSKKAPRRQGQAERHMFKTG